MLKYALLGFLNYEPLTGYDLKQIIDQSISYFWHAKQSQIYNTLKKLEQGGRLTSEIVPQEGRPNRRIYTITEAGREELRQWLAQPLTTLTSRKERLLLKVFFSAQIDKDSLLTQLRLQRTLHQQQLELYQTKVAGQIEQHAAEMPQLSKDALLWEATRRMGELHEQAYIHWLDETMAMIKEKF